MSLNLPDKHVRKAVSDALSGLVVDGNSIPTFDTHTTEESPYFYVVMSTQTNNEAKDNKCEPRWNSSILLDIITRYSGSGNIGSRLLADNIADEVLTRVDNLTLSVDSGLYVNRQIITMPNDITTKTGVQNIFRKLIRIELVIDKL